MKSHQWGQLFDANIETYRGARPKRAEYVLDFIRSSGCDVHSILEMGAFSGKDIRYLAKRLKESLCCSLDREQAVFDRAARDATSCVVADAFRMPFCDKAFGITFHSGLIVVFDDRQSRAIIEEQLRVTSGYAIVFAHNRWNFIDIMVSAIRRARGNSLFRYRRFSKGLLRQLVPAHVDIVRIDYVDNMLVNVTRRRAPWLLKPVSRIAGLMDMLLCNEVVVIVRAS
ncbi:class I SAM-dependent methyltransferase [Lysobacter capsici]|uniref:class I SAM-dependent methyltransferase n=1 Tax=Lysobacter capsici TaxID=435897 RepID=UPI001C00172D|nr:class I SAM-dependent methyltransferase [Lysobacter capsici]QWF16043.1 class I SAM-dependent methyltransferase [Lysobacter capsici]